MSWNHPPALGRDGRDAGHRQSLCAGPDVVGGRIVRSTDRPWNLERLGHRRAGPHATDAGRCPRSTVLSPAPAPITRSESALGRAPPASGLAINLELSPMPPARRCEWVLGPHFLLTMFLGTTIVGLVGAAVVYFSSQRIIDAFHAWHARRVSKASQNHHEETPGQHPP